MKTYRRIEIRAFRRLKIISGEPSFAEKEGSINDAETEKPIEPESAEGQRVLLEAVRLVEVKLLNRAKGDAESE